MLFKSSYLVFENPKIKTENRFTLCYAVASEISRQDNLNLFCSYMQKCIYAF